MVDSIVLARSAMAAVNGLLLASIGLILYATSPDRATAERHVIETRRMVAMVLLIFGVKRLLDAFSFTLVNAADPAWWGNYSRAVDASKQIAQWCAIAGLLYVLPRPPPWRSVHGVMFAAFAGWVVVGSVLFLFHEGFLWTGWRLGEAPQGTMTLAGWFMIRFTGIHLLLLLLMVSTLVRAAQLKDRAEMHNVHALLALLFTIPFWNLGRQLIFKGQDWYAGRLDVWVSYWRSVPGDCCDVVLRAEIALYALIVGVVGYMLIRGSYLVLVPVALAILSALFVDASGGPLWTLVWTFPIVGVLLVIGKRGYAGGLDLSPQVSLFLSGALFALTYLFVNLLFFAMYPQAAFTMPAAILVGAMLGVVAAVLAHPNGRSWVAQLGGSAAAVVGDRLEAYRTALAHELASGTTPQDATTRLRPLRSRLGISEREHAVMEHLLRDDLENLQMRPTTLLQEGADFLGRYGVRERLGRGGGGAVFLCNDTRLGREVVLKELSRGRMHTRMGDLVREARAFAAVQHPNVLTLYDVEEVGDRAVLVMEHAPGGSLTERLREGALDQDVLDRLVSDLLEGLAVVHGAGLVHRDVKPSNILLDGEGSFKLGDFGIAHMPGFETTAAGFGDWENPVGTVRYMSPEQARGDRVGAASDLYSAAVTVYEATVGRSYVEVTDSTTPVEVQLAIASVERFSARLDGHEVLREWFERALAPAPQDRFRDAREMLAAYREARGGGPARPAAD